MAWARTGASSSDRDSMVIMYGQRCLINLVILHGGVLIATQLEGYQIVFWLGREGVDDGDQLG